jgi:hypothetical protein
MRFVKEWAVHFSAQRYLEAKMDPAQFLMNDRDDPWDLLAYDRCLRRHGFVTLTQLSEIC